MAEKNNFSHKPNRQADQHIKPVRPGIPSPLHPGVIYHIYNRGVNGETIFKENRNYEYFVNLYVKHIQPVAETYAFCLLPNHFHILGEIKDLSGLKPVSQFFSNLFNAY